MPLIRTVAPTAEPLTLAQAKAHLKVEIDDDDALIGALITAARQHLDGADGWLGRALMPQTWRLTLDCFPRGKSGGRTGWIKLPLPPLISVDSVTYVDTDGATQTLAEASYQLIDGGDWPSCLAPAWNTEWPETRDQPAAVSITFQCGYAGATASPVDSATDVPETARAAMKLLIAHWYQNREAVAASGYGELPLGVCALLLPLRVSWV